MAVPPEQLNSTQPAAIQNYKQSNKYATLIHIIPHRTSADSPTHSLLDNNGILTAPNNILALSASQVIRTVIKFTFSHNGHILYCTPTFGLVVLETASPGNKIHVQNRQRLHKSTPSNYNINIHHS